MMEMGMVPLAVMGVLALVAMFHGLGAVPMVPVEMAHEGMGQ